MKKHFFFYLFTTLIFCSLTTEAMEDKKDDFVNQELQKIAAIVFPSPVYQHDSHPDDKEKYTRARNAIQKEWVILNVPEELFVSAIFPHMDSQTLFCLGSTCHFFKELSRLSVLFLNDYCLTERMPHQIPVSTLRFKIHNTKDGLLKLATLVSVSAQDLCGWFEPPYLESIFSSCYGRLPQQLAGQSEEELGTLYPILKIAVAATQAKVAGADQTDHIMRLVHEYPVPYGLSFNKLQLLSLNPDRPGVYEFTLMELIISEQGYGSREMDITKSKEREVIARELLIRGKYIDLVYHICFPDNHLKGEAIELQLLGLCAQYPNLYALCIIVFILFPVPCA